MRLLRCARSTGDKPNFLCTVKILTENFNFTMQAKGIGSLCESVSQSLSEFGSECEGVRGELMVDNRTHAKFHIA